MSNQTINGWDYLPNDPTGEKTKWVLRCVNMDQWDLQFRLAFIIQKGLLSLNFDWVELLQYGVKNNWIFTDEVFPNTQRSIVYLYIRAVNLDVLNRIFQAIANGILLPEFTPDEFIRCAIENDWSLSNEALEWASKNGLLNIGLPSAKEAAPQEKREKNNEAKTTKRTVAEKGKRAGGRRAKYSERIITTVFENKCYGKKHKEIAEIMSNSYPKKYPSGCTVEQVDKIVDSAFERKNLPETIKNMIDKCRIK